MRASLAAHVVVAAVITTAGALSTPAGASPAPVRSGTILGGWFPGAAYVGPSPAGCSVTAECAAWLASGCRPELAGRDPGLHDSIVSLRGISRARAWELRVRPEQVVAGAPSLVWGGLTLELWDGGCQPLMRIGPTHDDYHAIDDRARFRMPPNAVWMTLASSDNTRLRWALYRTHR
jgi:hypothetical protein